MSSRGRVTASASTPATSRRAAIAWVSGEAAAEVAGVGDQARVEAAGGRQVDGRVHRVEQVQHDDGGGLGPRVDVVVGRRSRGWTRGGRSPGSCPPWSARSASGPSRSTLPVSRTTSSSGAATTSSAGTTRPSTSRSRSDSAGTRGRAERHLDLGAAPMQGEAEGQRAAERVGVRVDVREQRHLAGGGEHARPPPSRRTGRLAPPSRASSTAAIPVYPFASCPSRARSARRAGRLLVAAGMSSRSSSSSLVLARLAVGVGLAGVGCAPTASVATSASASRAPSSSSSSAAAPLGHDVGDERQRRGVPDPGLAPDRGAQHARWRWPARRRDRGVGSARLAAETV